VNATPSPRELRVVPPISPRSGSAVPEIELSGPAPGRQSMPDDRDLARRLSRVELITLDAAVWRHLSPREQPRPDSGEGARGTGGRFNPPGSFPVVYGSLSRTAAGAEFRRLAKRHPIGIEKLLPRHVYRFRLKSAKAVDLRQPPIRRAVGLPSTGLASVHSMHTQLIGEVARALGIEVIIAPSLSGQGDMVAIFPDLIWRSGWEIRHVEFWARMDDVPGADDAESFVSGMTG